MIKNFKQMTMIGSKKKYSRVEFMVKNFIATVMLSLIRTVTIIKIGRKNFIVIKFTKATH